jgi:hypothetical protein
MVFISFVGYGQEYLPMLNNSGWCCESYVGTGAWYSEYAITGTELFNDQIYIKVEDAYFFQEDSISEQVWYLKDGANELIYDFSLEINDTFQIELFDTVIATYTVSEIDVVQTLSGSRKRLFLHLNDSISIAYGSIDRNLIWIEGIGSTYGPVYPNAIPLINEYGGSGSCLEAAYSIDRIKIYQGNCTYIRGYFPDECKFIKSSVIQIEDLPAEAFFNVIGNLEITSERKIKQVKIFDLSGIQVYHRDFGIAESNLIISNQFPTGIYICEMITDTNERLTVKTVKYFQNP